MAIILKETPSIEPLEAGMYEGICVQIFDLGIQTSPNFGDKHEIAIVFEIVGETVNTPDGEEPRRVIERRNMSFNQKSTLRKNLESWRGKKFSQDELRGFDIKNMLGINALVNVTADESKNGKVYNNINSINPPMNKSYKKHKPTMETFIFDMDINDENYKNFDKMPEYFQGVAKQAPEFQILVEKGLLNAGAVTDAATDTSADDLPTDEKPPF